MKKLLVVIGLTMFAAAFVGCGKEEKVEEGYCTISEEDVDGDGSYDEVWRDYQTGEIVLVKTYKK